MQLLGLTDEAGTGPTHELPAFQAIGSSRAFPPGLSMLGPR